MRMTNFNQTSKLFSSSLLALLVGAAACDMEAYPTDGEELDVGETEQEIYSPTSPPAPVATDLCDESSFAGTDWVFSSSAHFTAYYLPGTDAERDIATILAKREAAYENIRAALGIAASPTITVYLSPNRVAAGAKGRSMGSAYPGLDRYEVVYSGAADSFENARVGNLLTRTMEYHVDPANARRLPILSTGLAELLDQSGRNLHDAYAQRLIAGVETRVRVTSFESNDLSGKNVGRAGSLVKFMVDRYGMATFLDIFKGATVAPVSGCSMKNSTYGCINTPAALTAMLDGLLQANAGESWASFAGAWNATVSARIAKAPLGVTSADTAAIKNLVDLMDQGIITDDPAIYRSTMEGFYCDWNGEAGRAEIAERVTDALRGAKTATQRIYPTGVQNFSTARVLLRRVDERGAISYHTMSAEKFPQGWRITWGPDWF